MKIRKIFAAILAVIMVFGASVSVYARSFTRDDYPTQWTFADGRTIETFFDEQGNFVGRQDNGVIIRLVRANVIGMPNSFNGGLVTEAAIRNGRVENPSTVSTIPPTPISGLFTDTELLAMIEEAPSREDTRSATTIPNRRLTDNELNAWIAEYHALGGMNAFELEVAMLINEVRVQYGLRPLAISPELSIAARFHSQEMDDLSFFAHTSPNTGTVAQRSAMFGETAASEIIAGGTPAGAVERWLNSPGHRNAMLHPDRTYFGIGGVGDGPAVVKLK